MSNICIIDGYIDEPTCLGVPPYISPYPRYIYGAIKQVDKQNQVSYFTIDQIRDNTRVFNDINKSDLTVIIAGMSVPGRYLSGFPVSPREIGIISKNIQSSLKMLVGPAARYGFGLAGGKKTWDVSLFEDSFDIISRGDPEIIISELLQNNFNLDRVNSNQCRSDASDIRPFAIYGSEIVKKHPFYPDYLICEIETFRGCPRSIVGGCSFCSEPLKGVPDHRPVKDVVDEIQALYKQGVRHFRLGNQPCIFSYQAKDSDKLEFPCPNPKAIDQLFTGIRNIAPDVGTLHIDNANPGTLAHYPDECRKIGKIIVENHTSGDVAALGVESVDPRVIKENNLKADAEDVIDAIQLLNEIGAKRGSNGLPELLPGLNFVFGLKGETKKTYELDLDFLTTILDKGLLVRRVNLRQVIPIPGTRMYEIGNKIMNKHKHFFKGFKIRVQQLFDRSMLIRLVPIGTVLKQVYTEKLKGSICFGRQLGSYPLLVGIPGFDKTSCFIDVKIVDYGFRSITGVPYPLDINIASRKTLEALPGLSKKRVIRILANRPIKNKEHLKKVLDDPDVADNITSFIDV